jgi:hypothetical protein
MGITSLLKLLWLGACVSLGGGEVTGLALVGGVVLVDSGVAAIVSIVVVGAVVDDDEQAATTRAKGMSAMRHERAAAIGLEAGCGQGGMSSSRDESKMLLMAQKSGKPL